MEQQIQIKADDQTLKGVYSNLVLSQQSKEEFILDFLNTSGQGAFLLQRIFVSPSHAKRLSKMLEENVRTFEKQFGEIVLEDEPKQKIGFQA